MNISAEHPDTPESATGPTGPTPAPQAPQPTPEAPQAPDSAKFFLWLRSLGIPRGESRWLGGVCSGLAAKWGIDPVIVRGLLVVLTLFFGIGLLAYGVAWALLPEPDGRIHTEEVARGHWSSGMTGASVVTFLGMFTPGSSIVWGVGDGWSGGSWFWLLVVGGVIFWAINSGKSKPAGDTPVTQYSPTATATPAPGAPLGGWSGPPSPAYGYTPAPVPPVKVRPVKTTPRLGAAASLLALGLAVVVGAVVLMLDAANILELHGYELAAAGAAAAITAGVAIVVSGALGRTAGGVGSFAIVALLASGLLSLPPFTAPDATWNAVNWSPRTGVAAEAGRSVVFGNATIDLRGLDVNGKLSSELQIPLDVVASNVTILVDDNVPVRITSNLVAASLTVDGSSSGRSFVDESVVDVNPDASGPGLLLTLDGAASNVTVERGSD